MGVYGSPDTGNLYSNKKEEKKRNKRLQSNLWVWVAILIWNIIFVTTIGVRFDSVMTALISDSIIMAIISLMSLFYNLIKKRGVKDDIIFLLSSVVAFFALMLTLGAFLP